VILALFLVSVLVWKIICGIAQLGQCERSVTTIFSLVLPINGAQIGLSSARASSALALFTLGVWLVCQRRSTQTLFGLALISYTMFWPSFQVFALVTVVPLALGDLALQQNSKFTIIVGSLIPCLALANTYILANLVVHFGFFAQDDGFDII
jgi:multisubunit Na+/H+ antiporter MnhC subunit